MPRNNNKQQQSVAAPIPKNAAANDDVVDNRLLSTGTKMLLATFLFFTITFTALYYIGAAELEGGAGGEEDFEARGGVDADAEKGLFAIAAPCSASDFVSRAQWLVGNYSSIVRSSRKYGGTLNRWMEMTVRTNELKNKKGMLRAKMLSVQSQEIVEEEDGEVIKAEDDEAASAGGEEKTKAVQQEGEGEDSNSKGFDPTTKNFFDKEELERRKKACDEAEAALEKEPRYDGLTDADAERLNHLAFMLIRWAKGAKSFISSAEQKCDVEGLLDQKVEVGGKKNAIASSSEAEKEEATVPSSVLTVKQFISRDFMPVLYGDSVELLRFSFSYADAKDPAEKEKGAAGATSAASDEDETTDMRNFAESAALHYMDQLVPQLQPFRDVLIRTLMSLADVAFATEREDYQIAYLAQLVRLADGIVTTELLATSTAKTSFDILPAESFFAPSCTSKDLGTVPALLCSSIYGTRLVSAKGGSSYTRELSEDEEQSRDYTAYLFGLLRTTFLEELIALLSQSAPELRVAYAASLLELQRYESASKALLSAKSHLEQMIQAYGNGNSNDGTIEQRNNNNSDEKKRACRRAADLKRYELALELVTHSISCLQQDEMLNYASLLQQKHGNLKIPMRWSKLLSLRQCGVPGAGSKNSTVARAAASAVSLRWPLAGHGNDFVVDPFKKKNTKSTKEVSASEESCGAGRSRSLQLLGA